MALDDLARQADPDVGEIDLGFLAGQVDLRDHARQVPAAFQYLGLDLRAPGQHVVADRGVRHQVEVVLLGKTLMDPAGRVLLLARRTRVFPQHRVDPRLGRVQDSDPWHWLLPRRRNSRQKGLPHRPAMDSVLFRQNPLRHLRIKTLVPPDRSEQFRPRQTHPGLPT